ncbi:MAG TPA: hypothetical protein VE673_13765 [Pseudonocardiaceae bacterium]|jgi:hypothetical protein|nr:hypothetical protein [Pseudonocardiaceae bacterium]
MSETRSDVVQVDGQHVELLPARTVLSTLARADESYGNEDAGALDSLLGRLPSLDNATSGGEPGVSGAAGGATRGI